MQGITCQASGVLVGRGGGIGTTGEAGPSCGPSANTADGEGSCSVDVEGAEETYRVVWRGDPNFAQMGVSALAKGVGVGNSHVNPGEKLGGGVEKTLINSLLL